jgi:hypothetical protein
MGVGYFRIKFENSFPSLEEIRLQFFKQTGLSLRVTVEFNLDRINRSYLEMISLLYKDAKQVDHIQTELRQLINAEPQNYEKLAQMMDQTKRQLGMLNHLGPFLFHITELYDLDVKVEDNVIEIECNAGQYYGVISLKKSLIDLGGKLLNSEVNYPKRWERLKKWDEYAWYNRPRK